jgi:large subunit ribosomal protein L25
MSEYMKLRATLREEAGKDLEKLRGAGMVPAVIYGRMVTPRNVALPYLDFAKAYKQAGENTIIELSIGTDKPVNVLIHDVQMSPLQNRFIHADFFQVRMDEEIETHVPLVFIGESPAVRELGGMLMKSIEELPVKTLPSDLPHSLEVDLSTLLTFEDHITVSDIKVSAKVTIDADPNMVIASVIPPRTEAEMETLDTKVEADVTKVEGVVKAESAASTPAEPVAPGKK